MTIKEEWLIQRNVIAWFNLQHPQHSKLLTYTMGGSHNFGPRKGATLKAMGLKAGIPDLNLFIARSGYHGLLLEVKGKGGKLSPVQKDYHQLLKAQGYCVEVGEGALVCIAIIKAYLGGGYPQNPSLNGLLV